MSGKFALIIGNTNYTDPGLSQLVAPGRDTEDFARVLKDREIGAFDDVKVLLNETEPVVREAIDDFFNQKKPDDLLVLYFSGHGVKDEFGALYLAVKNTFRTKLRSTAVKSDYIREAMDQSRSRRQVLILDCCNSGAFAQGTKAATGGSIGTGAAFEGGYGRVILTASDSTQFAWEGDKFIGDTDNSLFTHFLVEGLQGQADLDSDGRITVDELYDFAYEKVRLVTPKQTPSKFSSRQQGEIVLRESIPIEKVIPLALPAELVDEIEDARPYVREAAVQKLEKILRGANLGMARTAKEALVRIAADDDSRRVSQAAGQILETIRQAEQRAEEQRQALEKAEQERLASEKAAAELRAEQERQALENAEQERVAREKAAAELKAEQERKAIEKAEQERQAQEKTAATLKAEEVRKAKEKAEQERLARERAAAELKVEEERKAREAAPLTSVQATESKPGPQISRKNLVPAIVIGVIILCGILVGLGAYSGLFNGLKNFIAGLPNNPQPTATAAPAAIPTSAPAATSIPAATASPLAVGIVLPTRDEPRWLQDEIRFQDALKASGYTAEILFSQGDSVQEKVNVETLLSKGIKVLIICPVDSSAASAAVEEAHRAGVKVIDYDRLITGTDSVDFNVIFDSYSVGQAQAQYLLDHNTTKRTPLYLYAGAATDVNSFMFFYGAWEILQPKIADGTFVIKNSSEAEALQSMRYLTHDQESRIIDQITTNWDYITAKGLAETNLAVVKARDKGNVAILAPNDGTARAIADTFAADKDILSYTITGQDAEKASIQYIIDGKQSMTVFKDVRMLVKDAISTALVFLQGGTPKSTTTFSNGSFKVPTNPSAVISVDRSNLKAVLIDSGYYNASDFTGLLP